MPISWPLAPLRWWTVRASHVGVPLSVITLILIAIPDVPGLMLSRRWCSACGAAAVAGALLHLPVGMLASATSRSASEDHLGWVTLMLGLFLFVLAGSTLELR